MPNLRVTAPRSSLATVLALALALPACALDGAAGDTGDPPAAPGPRWVVDGRADGAAAATFVRCVIEPGTGPEFFQQDTLRCAPGTATWLTRASVQVTGTSGYVGTLDLASGEATATFWGSSYPVALQVTASIEGVLGVEARRVRETITVAKSDELAAWRALEAPIDAWPLDVEARTTGGVVDLDAHDITLTGATLDATDGVATLAVGRAFEHFAAGEKRTLLVAVAHGAGAGPITGNAGSTEVDALTPFVVDRPGEYVLRAGGLIRREDLVAPPGSGPELVACRTVSIPATDTVEAAEVLRCALVMRRPGIAVAAARVQREMVATTLPLDGSFVDVGPRGTEPLTLRVVVTGVTGIDGFASSSPLSFDDALTFGEGIRDATLPLPFDLMHARFVFAASVSAAYFDATATTRITFRRLWAGRFDQDTRPRLAPTREAPHTWIAVDPGRATPIPGRLAVVSDAGGVEETALELAEGDYLVGTSGATPAVTPASGTELARCWIDEGALVCELPEAAPVLSVTLSLTLERLGGRRIDRVLHSGRSRVISVASLLPLGVSLGAEVVGGPAPVVAQTRVTAVTDLPVSEPLVVRAP